MMDNKVRLKRIRSAVKHCRRLRSSRESQQETSHSWRHW